MILRAGTFTFAFPRPALIMGIVNVTPDSFSDGGRFLEANAAVDRALQLVAEGAEIIDIGGESTRPNAEPVEPAEELRRVLPVLDRLRGKTAALISIDTYKPLVAREAISAGAAMVNDVWASREDDAMWQLVAERRVAYVAMHMQGTPRTMQRNPTYHNVRQEVAAFLEERLRRLAAAGVEFERIVLDVGIGFGKRREHNLELLAGLRDFTGLGRPLLIGLSRKSFLGSASEPNARLPAALAASCWSVASGVQLVRTHDVGPTLQAIRMVEEIMQKLPAEA